MTDIIQWPSWRYGPNGAAEIFNYAEEVPAGWVDHPSLVKETDNGKPTEEALKADAPDEGQEGQVLTAGDPVNTTWTDHGTEPLLGDRVNMGYTEDLQAPEKPRRGRPPKIRDETQF